MQRKAKKTRDFRFFSKKGGTLLTVHSELAYRYAKWLESQEDVRSYDCCVPLCTNEYTCISSVGIRKAYFLVEWETDFAIHSFGGEDKVREFVREVDIENMSIREQLELSRRYWAYKGISDWKIVLCKGGISWK